MLGAAYPFDLFGRHDDSAGDIYALGVMLYQMCCGRLPYRGRTPAATMMAILDGDYPQPRSLREDVPERFARAIEGALAADSSRRPRSAEALAELAEVPLSGVVPGGRSAASTSSAAIIGVASAGRPGSSPGPGIDTQTPGAASGDSRSFSGAKAGM